MVAVGGDQAVDQGLCEALRLPSTVTYEMAIELNIFCLHSCFIGFIG